MPNRIYPPAVLTERACAYTDSTGGSLPHHYGIWNPWTKVKIGGREVDFWNLGEGQGTVRFAGIESIQSGDAWGGICVRHEHVDFKAPGGAQVVMEETRDNHRNVLCHFKLCILAEKGINFLQSDVFRCKWTS